MQLRTFQILGKTKLGKALKFGVFMLLNLLFAMLCSEHMEKELVQKPVSDASYSLRLVFGGTTDDQKLLGPLCRS